MTRTGLVACLLGAVLFHGCNQGGEGNGSPVTQVTLSGRVFFEKIPSTEQGLDFNHKNRVPVSLAKLEVVDSQKGSVIASGKIRDGQYELRVPASTTVSLRAYALAEVIFFPPFTIQVTAIPGTNSGGSAPVYAARSMDIFTGQDAVKTLDFLISDADRGSGPFNILDVALDATDFLWKTWDNSSLRFPNMTFRWSPAYTGGTEYRAQGEIYMEARDEIYVDGDRVTDSDEFDDHVIAHEIGHMVQARLLRDDSMGGSHSTGDKLDVRVAFSEGFATAFACMVLGDHVYLDSVGPGGGQVGVRQDLEDHRSARPKGHAYEESVAAILWDLFDSENEPGDGVSVDFETLVDPSSFRDLPITYLHSYLEVLVTRISASDVRRVLALESVTHPEPAGNTFRIARSTNGPSEAFDVTLDGSRGANKFDANCLFLVDLGSPGWPFYGRQETDEYSYVAAKAYEGGYYCNSSPYECAHPWNAWDFSSSADVDILITCGGGNRLTAGAACGAFRDGPRRVTPSGQPPYVWQWSGAGPDWGVSCFIVHYRARSAGVFRMHGAIVASFGTVDPY